MNSELLQALDMLEKEKEISKDVLFTAIEDSLKAACKKHLGKENSDKYENVAVEMDRETGDFRCYYEREVVETEDEVEDPILQISLEEAAKITPSAVVGDVIRTELDSADFGRIAAKKAKDVILQKIREEEKSSVYNLYKDKVGQVVTGIVQRYMGSSISINLGKADAQLAEKEIVPEENLQLTERVKVYILGVPETKKGGFKILVSRTHANLVRRLFEEEVTEIKDGTVEIVNVAREPGSRTKMAVRSNDPDVDPVGACVGQSGSRVDAVVAELRNEKIDIVEWDENPGNFIQNALSPAKIVAVFADPEEKTAKVVVPDYQLSLAIGKSGQNARLAAKLTGYKIDIKSETQAKDAPGFRYEDYLDDEEYDEDGYDEDYAEGEYEEDGYGETYEESADDSHEEYAETDVEEIQEENAPGDAEE